MQVKCLSDKFNKQGQSLYVDLVGCKNTTIIYDEDVAMVEDFCEENVGTFWTQLYSILMFGNNGSEFRE